MTKTEYCNELCKKCGHHYRSHKGNYGCEETPNCKCTQLICGACQAYVSELSKNGYCKGCEQDHQEAHFCGICGKQYRSIEEDLKRYQVISEFGMWDDWDSDDWLGHCCKACYEKHIKPLFEKKEKN